MPPPSPRKVTAARPATPSARGLTTPIAIGNQSRFCGSAGGSARHGDCRQQQRAGRPQHCRTDREHARDQRQDAGDQRYYKDGENDTELLPKGQGIGEKYQNGERGTSCSVRMDEIGSVARMRSVASVIAFVHLANDKAQRRIGP